MCDRDTFIQMPGILRVLACHTLVALALLVAAADRAAAQFGERQSASPRWEGRLEGTFAEAPGAHVGIGLGTRAGWYARPSLLVAAGAVRGSDDVWRGSQRADLVLRFLLDPFGERPRGWYGGAGVSLQQVGDQRRGVVLLLAGVEGRARRGVRPALEIGVGGGVRLGLVLRRARPDSR
jgi:hypothetical protein